MEVRIKQKETFDVKWTAAAVTAFIECISVFIPWVSIYYGRIIKGMSISCAGFFELVYGLLSGNAWIEYQPECLTPLDVIDLLGINVLCLNA